MTENEAKISNSQTFCLSICILKYIYKYKLWCLILDKYQFDCRFNFKNISVFYQDKLCTTLKIVSDSEVEETPDTVETVALPPPPFSFSGNNYTNIHNI